MAFRRLTVAERFAFKGPTSWRPLLANPSVHGDPQKCRWGFVPQTKVRKVLAQRTHQIHTHFGSARQFIEGPSIREDFDRFNIDFDEFKEGAGAIYGDVTSLFCDPMVDFRDIELVSPRLSLFLNDCLVGYEAAGYPAPSIEVDPESAPRAITQDLSLEFGNIDHYGKYFGMWDAEEVRFHLLGGISPEISTANEFTGDGPRRLVASVIYEVREKVWFEDREDKPEEFESNAHYFEFESPPRRIDWRLRNINKAIDTL
mmetsp:Transcript_2219/g.5462  ORF Transcript_2219/g.5462 Transcript_2219/m.5462 type:complete len:258 (+) Transcript_2219:156-929(+)|eukprot:CAMPEP_0182921636 /NCGR_PEP_ID=MMETSP0105_2-20130417/4266_1 /TAXON_ID=81532 ORGANISM="Acanthoeca-like sp., Strain 10tr" /NCGR_SAMPLE_ID=MMETSP0105_2 /ASSEMBLY_ACC=CAM_ASM_000205 /LENGTH=257 /DNA_ID=CAMNT_0025059167 /DNA_START=154 /DNA_END=927 /DNA_ORIENTATION=-